MKKRNHQCKIVKTKQAEDWAQYRDVIEEHGNQRNK